MHAQKLAQKLGPLSSLIIPPPERSIDETSSHCIAMLRRRNAHAPWGNAHQPRASGHASSNGPEAAQKVGSILAGAGRGHRSSHLASACPSGVGCAAGRVVGRGCRTRRTESPIAGRMSCLTLRWELPGGSAILRPWGLGDVGRRTVEARPISFHATSWVAMGAGRRFAGTKSCWARPNSTSASFSASSSLAAQSTTA